MAENKTLYLLGYASGLAGANLGCTDGPLVLQKSSYLSALTQQGINLIWQGCIQQQKHGGKVESVQQQCKELALEIARLVKEKQFFIVQGGDHTSAIGTWSGVNSVVDPIGLIWIDAHMDSHTPETTLSGNLHGMPLACLLGYGDAKLTKLITSTAKIKPEHVCLIGVRSYEAGEKALLDRLKVRIFYMEEIRQRGLAAVFDEAVSIATRGTSGYGISIDLDGIDPLDAPGTGMAVPNGIAANDLCQVLTQVSGDPRLLGAEIVEFDPHLDREQQTEKLIVKLIHQLSQAQ